MKNLLAVCFFLIQAYCQAGPTNPVFEILNDSTMKFYYDGFGMLTNESAAQFYRIINVKTIENNLTGNITDYYTKGRMILNGKLNGGLLNDSATFYYESGLIKETGIYKDGHRIGLWKFYYPNGSLKKVIEFADIPIIQEFYSKNGKALINKGNGKYKDRYIVNYKHMDYFEISGTVRNGLMEKEWLLTYNNVTKVDLRQHNVNVVYSDIFDKGNFVEGKGNFDHTVYSKDVIYPGFKSVDQKHNTPVVKLTDFCPQEELNIFLSITSPLAEAFDNNTVPTVPIKISVPLFKYKPKGPVCYEYSLLKLPYYDENQNLGISFFPTFEKIVKSRIDSIGKSLLFTQFHLDQNGQIDDVVLFSNNKGLTQYFSNIIEELEATSHLWTPVQKKDFNRSFDSYCYIPAVITLNNIQLGNYCYKTEYSSTDLSDLIEFK